MSTGSPVYCSERTIIFPILLYWTMNFGILKQNLYNTGGLRVQTTPAHTAFLRVEAYSQFSSICPWIYWSITLNTQVLLVPESHLTWLTASIEYWVPLSTFVVPSHICAVQTSLTNQPRYWKLIITHCSALMGQTQQVSAFLLNPAVLWQAPNGVIGALPVPDGV